MRSFIAALVSMVFILAVSAAPALSESKEAQTFKAKAGDTIYVCGCGAGCDCGVLSHKTAKCACGMDLVKTTVTRVEKERIYYMLNGKELSAPAVGKYVCPCGPGCNCGMISQKPGTCGCGKPLKKAS